MTWQAPSCAALPHSEQLPPAILTCSNPTPELLSHHDAFLTAAAAAAAADVGLNEQLLFHGSNPATIDTISQTGWSHLLAA
jgi:hypothetical protein